MGIHNVNPPPLEVDGQGISLPLMGIHNLHVSGRQSGLLFRSHYPSWGFITSSVVAVKTGGSTHYPSWGFITQNSPNSLRRTILSLPLMGIHNSAKTIMGVSLTSISLPLMGIHNTGLSRTTWDTSTAHYPSWGFITPHGHPTVVPARAHYPSWGFITSRSCWCRSWGVSHYPSWGFITVISSSCRFKSATSHYPSWGFITSYYWRCRQGCGSHYPSWGFITQGRFFQVADAFLLITPHGDS